MKRGLSDSDSECDDVFDDSKAGSPSQSCQISDRKRRRGVIEKRRRDRINSSLSELRRLVPSAFEKQGSAKLEKAEILQMTVDYLKLLHQKGLNSYNGDPHTLAKDYRYVGFKECASEVARYLVAVEGLDLQDPLRMRLLSHLQCFPSQRDAVAVKASFQCGASSAWAPAPSFNSQYGSVMPSATATFGGGSGTLSSGHAGSGSLGPGSLSAGSLGTGTLQPQSTTEIMTSNATSSLLNVFSDARCLAGSGDGGSSGGGCGSGLGGGLHANPRSGSGMVPSSSAAGSVHATSMTPPLFHSLSQFHPTPQFPAAAQSLGMPPSAYPHPHPTSAVHSSGVGLQQSSSVKPYRPWGGELAY